MSLAIMAIRLAVKAALSPYAPPETPATSWPTLAHDRIFDSRFDLLDGRGGERTPLIVFAIEAVDGNAYSGQNGAIEAGRGFDISTRLVLSAQVTSRQAFFDPDTAAEFEAEAADLLDQELADILAALQDQAWATLMADPLFKQVTKRTTKLDAEPYPASETGDKLAVLANSYFVEPLGDGEKALSLVRDALPTASPVRARAVLALERLGATRAYLAAAAAIRSGFAPQPFAVDSLAQGAAPPTPEPAAPPAPVPSDRFPVTLDPEDPIP
jgi:hypothetical protein